MDFDFSFRYRFLWIVISIEARIKLAVKKILCKAILNDVTRAILCFRIFIDPSNINWSFYLKGDGKKSNRIVIRYSENGK